MDMHPLVYLCKSPQILTARLFFPHILGIMLYTSTDRLVGNSSLLTRFFGWIRHARPIWDAAKPQKSDSADYVEPQHLTFAEQWSHLSDTIKGALSCAEDATRCHASAALQLDLAQYALSSLVDELSAVMDVGGRRRPANVHMLDFQPPRPFGDAIAA
jgi:hypothetical protein